MTASDRLDDLRRRVQRDPASIAFAQLAEECRRANLFDECIEVCRAGLARHPGYLSARVTLARALMQVEALEEALNEFQEVLKSAPENLAALRGVDEIRQRRSVVAGDGGPEVVLVPPPGPVAFRRPAVVAPPSAPAAPPSSAPRGAAAPPLPAAARQPAPAAAAVAFNPERDRAVRTVAALEQLLTAVHVTRADRRA